MVGRAEQALGPPQDPPARVTLGLCARTTGNADRRDNGGSWPVIPSPAPLACDGAADALSAARAKCSVTCCFEHSGL